MAEAYGTYTMNVAQVGSEVTPGTAVAATRIFRGIFPSVEDDRTRNQSEEHIGTAFPAERSYDTLIGATIPVDDTELTFEQFPLFLESSIKKPTPSGTTPTVTRVYDVPFDITFNTIRTMTWRIGNNLVTADVQVVPYVFTEDWTISGEFGASWMMSANMRGQQITTGGALTPALALETVVEAPFNATKLYLDASGGVFGTTLIAGVLNSMEIKYESGIVFVPAVSGTGELWPIKHKFTRPTATFTMTLELHDNTGVSRVALERAVYRANGTRLMQIDIPGSGTRNINIKACVKYDSFGAYEEADGDTTVTIEGHMVYSPADAQAMQITVINPITAY